MGNIVIKSRLEALKNEKESLNSDSSDVNKVKVKKSVEKLKIMFDTNYKSSLKNSEAIRIKNEFYSLYNVLMERVKTISVPKIVPQQCSACGRFMAYSNAGVPVCRLRGDNFKFDINNQTVTSCSDACYYNSKCQTAELVYPMKKIVNNVNYFADKKEFIVNDWTDAWCKNTIKNNIDAKSIEGTRSYYGDCPIPVGEDVPAQMILRNKNTGKPLPESVAVRVSSLPTKSAEKILGQK